MFLIGITIALAILNVIALFGIIIIFKRTKGLWQAGLIFGMEFIYSIAYAVELMAPEIEIKLIMNHLQYTAIPFIAIVWLIIAKLFENPQYKMKKTFFLYFVLPFLTFLAVQTFPYWDSGIYYTYAYIDTANLAANMGLAVMVLGKGPFYYISCGYTILILIHITLLYFRVFKTKKGIRRKEAFFLALCTLICALGLLPTMVTPETSGIDLSLYLIQVIGYIILYMLFRYEVIDLRPTAHRATFEMSSDPIIILDDEYCIISWNDAFSKCHDINPVYRQNIDDYFENKDVAEAIHSGITFGFSYRNKQYILETIPLSPENENKRGFIIKFNDMTSYIERIETLSYEASHDELTNIFNRRAFVERAQKYILENAEKHEPFSLAMIDIDNFKDINDNFGHVAGDCILEELSAFITKELPMGALFARYGGEEFVILFPNLDDEISFDLAEHVRLMTANHLFTAGNQKTHIYISLGVCHARTGNETLLRDLINKSDEAMYLSKKAGKNQVTSIR